MPMNLQELRQKHAGLCDQQQAIVDKAVTEGRPMTEEETTKFNDLQAQIDGLAKTIQAAEAVEARAKALDAPVDTPPRFIPGDYSQVNNKLDDGGFANVGELLNVIRHGDSKGRVEALPLGQGEGGGRKVPDAFAAQLMPWRFKNEWTMGVGEEGGFMVPSRQISSDPLMIKPEDAIVRPRATAIPAGDPPDGQVTVPAFSQGSAGVFGGVTVTWIGEGDLKPETDGKLREVALLPKEVAATTVVTDKLLRNWAAAANFLSTLLRGATLAAEDMAGLVGNGVNKPFGVQNCPGAIAVNRAGANAIAYADIVNMLARLLPESVGRAVWVCNQSAMPQIVTLQDPAGHYIYIAGDATRGIPATLAGIPIKFTGKTSTLGSKGDLMLVDFAYYLIKDGSGPFVAASEHVLFRQNKTVVKVFWNVDGQGWIDQPLTLEDGSTTVSAYVVLDVPAV
ncbi:MAG: phage major capsid protein [Clostridia bacterium]|nr:phage major capsid protein [Clostridia bacterium]